MSNQIKTIIALLVLIIVIIIGWLWYSMSSTTVPAYSTDQTSQVSSTQSASVADAGLSTASGDTSDAALQSDLNSIETYINASDY